MSLLLELRIIFFKELNRDIRGLADLLEAIRGLGKRGLLIRVLLPAEPGVIGRELVGAKPLEIFQLY